MQNAGLLSLICALSSGVFGFAANSPSAWTWEKGACFVFLSVSAACFISLMISRPSPLWEALDDMKSQRF